ncbi:MAG: S1C family serine protease [Puniceicoccaceae bacterium]
MTSRFTLRSSWMLLISGWVSCACAQADFQVLQNRLIDIYNEHKNSVVRINALYEREDEEGQQTQDIRVATGFFVSRLGHILTTRSVVYEANQIWIEHDRVAYPAVVLGDDRRNNVALIKAEILPQNFSFIRLDDSNEQPPIASMVMGISLPLEFNPTPSFGMVTGYESSVYRVAFQTTHLRTNIFFGLGEGGTPVLDLNGRLVGMNVLTLLDIPSSYILPTRALFRIRDDLMFAGEVVYSWFGIEGRETTEVVQGSRVVVDEVVPGGPAEDVGIAAGDRLLEIGEFQIRTPSDVRNARFFARVGRFIRVKVLRGSEEREFSLKVAAVPPEELRKLSDEDAAPPAEEEESRDNES